MKVIDVIKRNGDLSIIDKENNKKFYVVQKEKFIGGKFQAKDFRRIGMV